MELPEAKGTYILVGSVAQQLPLTAAATSFMKWPMRSIIFLGMLAMVGAVTARADEPAAGKQVEQEFKTNGQAIPYLLYLPKDYGSKPKWPLMLFLHGRGESSGPLSTVKKWGPPRQIDHGEQFPFIVASPQCPRADFWSSPTQQQLLLALLDHLAGNCKVDPDRIYLTGLSMGGFGSWRLAADHPEQFAAVVPICGAGKPEDAARLKALPIWAWHGVADPTVPVQRSIEMVEAIKKAGGTNIRFTPLAHIGHNSWEAAYASPELYQWLEQQTASKNRERAAGTAPKQ